MSALKKHPKLAKLHKLKPVDSLRDDDRMMDPFANVVDLIDRYMPVLEGSHFRVLIYLLVRIYALDHRVDANGYFRVRTVDLAKACNLSERAAKASVAFLEDNELIRVDRHDPINGYVVLAEDADYPPLRSR